MKMFFPVLLAFFCTTGCTGYKTEAQIRTSGNGKVVVNSNTSKTTPKPEVFDIAKVDFKNFIYPEFSRTEPARTFTLKNGRAERKAGSPDYALRKTYYFDLTGDQKNEAITHIIANGCELGCESSSVFYIYTPDAAQPKLLWKIAIGGDTMGGLKSANFKIDEFTLETFGDCTLEDWLIKPEVDVRINPKLKTNSYTRFVFKRENGEYKQTERDVLPLPNLNLTDYRAQITFGK